MVKAIQFRTTGGPEVLKWEGCRGRQAGAQRGARSPTARDRALNFIDCYFRSGPLSHAVQAAGVGVEAAGIVEAVGRGVKHVKVGDRVAYVLGPLGAYAEARLIPAEHLIKLPRDIDFETAAAAMLKGTTAQYPHPPHLQGRQGRHRAVPRRRRRRRPDRLPRGSSRSAPRSSARSAATRRPSSPSATAAGRP